MRLRSSTAFAEAVQIGAPRTLDAYEPIRDSSVPSGIDGDGRNAELRLSQADPGKSGVEDTDCHA
jgi:hypothetical protein